LCWLLSGFFVLIVLRHSWVSPVFTPSLSRKLDLTLKTVFHHNISTIVKNYTFQRIVLSALFSVFDMWWNTLSRVRHTSLESHSKHLFPSTGCGVWQYLQTGQLNKTRRRYRLTNSTELVLNEPFATLSWFPRVYSYLTLLLKKNHCPFPNKWQPSSFPGFHLRNWRGLGNEFEQMIIHFRMKLSVCERLSTNLV